MGACSAASCEHVTSNVEHYGEKLLRIVLAQTVFESFQSITLGVQVLSGTDLSPSSSMSRKGACIRALDESVPPSVRCPLHDVCSALNALTLTIDSCLTLSGNGGRLTRISRGITCTQRRCRGFIVAWNGRDCSSKSRWVKPKTLFLPSFFGL